MYISENLEQIVGVDFSRSIPCSLETVTNFGAEETTFSRKVKKESFCALLSIDVERIRLPSQMWNIHVVSTPEIRIQISETLLLTWSCAYTRYPWLLGTTYSITCQNSLLILQKGDTFHVSHAVRRCCHAKLPEKAHFELRYSNLKPLCLPAISCWLLLSCHVICLLLKWI